MDSVVKEKKKKCQTSSSPRTLALLGAGSHLTVGSSHLVDDSALGISIDRTCFLAGNGSGKGKKIDLG